MDERLALDLLRCLRISGSSLQRDAVPFMIEAAKCSRSGRVSVLSMRIMAEDCIVFASAAGLIPFLKAKEPVEWEAVIAEFRKNLPRTKLMKMNAAILPCVPELLWQTPTAIVAPFLYHNPEEGAI